MQKSGGNSGGFWPQWHDNKLFALLLAILLVYVIVLTGAKIQETMLGLRSVGYSDQMPPTISVSATGEASTPNDIATVDIGVTNSASTSEQAQTDNTTKTNAIIAGLKELGIESKDLKTSNYSIYPQYNWDVSPSVIVGYEANQTITVKIRKSDQVSGVLQRAGALGATNISSLYFESEDDKAAENEARREAIAEAYAQAQDIAKAMNGRIVEVVSYSEYRGGDYYGYGYGTVYADSGMGGGMAPSIEAGEGEVSMTVNITFSIR